MRTAVYFWAIGFGFMFVELAAIQRLVLVLGHPVLATSAALAALLVFSGLGSAISDRYTRTRTSLACGLVALLAFVMATLAGSAGELVSLPLPARLSVSLLILAPTALLMGAPFPMGLRTLAIEPTSLAWAWASNSVASVIAASLATLLAMEIGGSGLIAMGGLCYVAASVVATSKPSAARDDEDRARG